MTLWRLRATVDDKPGFLALLTASLALRSVNILAVQVHTTEFGACDDFLVDAPDTVDEADLIAAIARGRGRDAWVARAEAHGLIDMPAHMAVLAGRLVQEPNALGEVLSTVLGGCLLRYEAGQPHLSPTTMRVGNVVLTRLSPTFTPAEFARAQALAEVARVAQVRPTVILLPDGTELNVRAAVESDLDGVEQMHSRCSERSLFQRYLAGSRWPGRTAMKRLLQPQDGVTLLALEGEQVSAEPEERSEAESRRAGAHVVAMANLVETEAALLVEDAWQRKGIGTALLRRVLRLAEGHVVLHTQSDNDAMLRTIRKFGEPVLTREGGLLTAILSVAQRVR